jgi:hypothetical protein
MQADSFRSLQTSYSYSARLSAVLLYDLFSVVWVYVVVKSRRPGLQRSILVLPVLLSNCLAPLLFNEQTELLTKVPIAFLAFWLTNFKVHAGPAVHLCVPATT